MKCIKFTRPDGTTFEEWFDEKAPCRICGLPVENASMGGNDICPSCDCGYYRNGEKWSFEGLGALKVDGIIAVVRKRAKEIEEEKARVA